MQPLLCPAQHPLTEENVSWYTAGSGKRHKRHKRHKRCRACHRNRMNLRYRNSPQFREKQKAAALKRYYARQSLGTMEQRA